MKSIGRNQALILGYGLYRNHTEEPWFRARELNDSFPNDELHPYKPINGSAFNFARNALREQKMVETKRGEVVSPGAPSGHRFVRATELGEEFLLDSVLYSVRNRGLTVPSLLEIPESIDAFLHYTDFEQRLVAVVTGIGITATSSQVAN